MKITRSKSWVWSFGHGFEHPEWQYREMAKGILFKNQLLSISLNENCYLIKGDPELLENWLGGDDDLSSYYDNISQPIEPGVYAVDIQTWVYSGNYEYPEDTDVDFSLENIREIDLENLPQIEYHDTPFDVQEEPPLFQLETSSRFDNYVTDVSVPPFHDMRTTRPRRPKGYYKRKKHKVKP